MNARWFRLYNDLINDPKIMNLSTGMRWRWVEILCCASKNNGKIPPVDDLAFMLRIKPTQALTAIKELMRANLVDEIDSSYVPHNWDSRQWISDAKDPTAKERKRRQRARERDMDVTSRCDSRDPGVPSSRPDTEQNQKQNRPGDDDGGDVRGARQSPTISQEALALAERLLVLAGHDQGAWPPSWCGAPLRVQAWLDQGWKPEIIETAVKAGVARKSGQAASSVQYFEKSIAEEHARQAAALPNVIVKTQETINVKEIRRARNESLGSVAIRLADAGIDFGPRPTGLRDPKSGAAFEPLSERPSAGS